MAIHVMQSQRIEVLFEAMLRAVQQPYQNPLMVLKAQHFIVPSIALETWLTQRLAEKRGISANNQFHHRIRGFQWWAYQEVLHDQRDEVRKANLPRLMIKWRIYQSLKNFIQSPINPLKQQHPLYPIIQRIYASADRLQGFEQLAKSKVCCIGWRSKCRVYFPIIWNIAAIAAVVQVCVSAVAIGYKLGQPIKPYR